jgi:hypothetical protein
MHLPMCRNLLPSGGLDIVPHINLNLFIEKWLKMLTLS